VNIYVADASVAGKWMLPGPNEPLQTQASQLLLQWTEGEIQLVVPDLFWTESANILWKAIRRGRCTRETAGAAMAALQSLQIPTVSSRPLLDAALDKAIAYGRTVYDCLYVVLAITSKAQLITADEKLANSLAAHLPVKWLGAF
jgi:predicted nucleic acid-binding protein